MAKKAIKTPKNNDTFSDLVERQLVELLFSDRRVTEDGSVSVLRKIEILDNLQKRFDAPTLRRLPERWPFQAR
jgi:hypothetical protein